MRVELPDKLFFKIGEVASLTEVKPHVLRYWESEFSCIRPQKSKTNQRLYRRADVEAVLAVKHLLYDRKFTIEGAKRQLVRTWTFVLVAGLLFRSRSASCCC